MTLRDQLRTFVPYNEQESRDRDRILHYMDAFDNIFSRDNALCHMTASAWVVNPARDRVLMAYHNIYQSWAWLGGHADGERDLLSVALREVREESGVQNIRPVSEDIYSVEILTVDGHEKRGQYISSHLHLNITYLIEADDRDPTFIKPDAYMQSWIRNWIFDHFIIRCACRCVAGTFFCTIGQIFSYI